MLLGSFNPSLRRLVNLESQSYVADLLNAYRLSGKDHALPVARRMFPSSPHHERRPYSVLNNLQCKVKFHSSSSSQIGPSTTTSHPSSSVEHSPRLPDLELPPPVPYISRTTALLTKSEAEQFLYPLYCRGWVIKSLIPNDGFNDGDRGSPFLVGNFTFKGLKSARGFLQKLMSIEEQEKHHVSINLSSGKRPILTITTQTHSARKAPPSESSSDNSTEPGITLRDIRLAVLLENLAKESNLLYSPEDSQSSHNIVRNPVSTWKELLSKYPWK